MAKLFRDVISDTYGDSTSICDQQKKKFVAQITENNNRITRSRELLLNDVITSAEYKEIKKQSEEMNIRLEAELSNVDENIKLDRNIFDVLDASLESLKKPIRIIFRGQYRREALFRSFDLS